jgi:hypothetical protein
MADKSEHSKVLTKEIAEQILADTKTKGRDSRWVIPFPGFDYYKQNQGPLNQVLDLSSFDNVTLDAAEVLVSDCSYPLYLGGLTSLTTDISAVLSKHHNWLLLTKLTTLSPESAAHLASQYHNSLIFDSLENLPAKSAEHLVTGQLSHLVFNHLPSSVVDALLATHEIRAWDKKPPHELMIQSSVTLDSRTAEALSYVLDVILNNIHELDEAAAYHLAQVEGTLCLNGLKQITVEAARALGRAKNTPSHLILNDLREISDSAATPLFHRKNSFLLELNGLTSLSVTAAKSLGQGFGGLYLNSLESLSDEAAAKLAKRREPQLYLDGLKNLSPVAAAALGSLKATKGNGSLSLNGITHLPASVAEGLAKVRVSDIDLRGVTELDAQTAAVCAKFRTRQLNLYGLKHLTPDAALELIGFPKDLGINDGQIDKFPIETQRVLLKHQSLQCILRRREKQEMVNKTQERQQTDD